jgi:hypothetical protein
MLIRPDVLVFLRVAETVIRRATGSGVPLSDDETTELATCISKLEKSHHVYRRKKDIPKTVDRIIADFMNGCSPLETYLVQGHPLTDLQHDSIAVTVTTLQTLLEVWRSQHRIGGVSPDGSE